MGSVSSCTLWGFGTLFVPKKKIIFLGISDIRTIFCQQSAVQLGMLWHYCLVTVHGGGILLVGCLMLQCSATKHVLAYLLNTSLGPATHGAAARLSPCLSTTSASPRNTMIPGACCPWSQQASLPEQNKWWGVQCEISIQTSHGRMRFPPVWDHPFCHQPVPSWNFLHLILQCISGDARLFLCGCLWLQMFFLLLHNSDAIKEKWKGH